MATKGLVSSTPKKTHFYILDASEDIDFGPYDEPTRHYSRQKAMRTLVENHFDCELHNVKFPMGSKRDAVGKYFKEQLKDKGKDDLMMVSFHGIGANTGKKYIWKFEDGYPRSKFNAYELIEQFVDSGVDTLILLDAYIADRFKNKWKLDDNNVEIIARGEVMMGENGRPVAKDKGDFTLNLARDLSAFVTNIDVPAKEGGYKGYEAPLTIPELLAKNPIFSANPRRVWLRRSGRTKKPARFVMNPEHMRETGKISWFLRGEETPSKNDITTDHGVPEGEGCKVPGPAPEPEDEGLGDDMDTEDDSESDSDDSSSEGSSSSDEKV